MVRKDMTDVHLKLSVVNLICCLRVDRDDQTHTGKQDDDDDGIIQVTANRQSSADRIQVNTRLRDSLPASCFSIPLLLPSLSSSSHDRPSLLWTDFLKRLTFQL